MQIIKESLEIFVAQHPRQPDSPRGGGGHVVMSDNGGNVIFGSVSDVTLTNVDNTISGAGHLGDGMMILVNEGTIIATGTNSLEIDTGTNTIVNSGIFEANGSGGLVIGSNVENSGQLWANGGNIVLHGSVTLFVSKVGQSQSSISVG